MVNTNEVGYSKEMMVDQYCKRLDLIPSGDAVSKHTASIAVLIPYVADEEMYGLSKYLRCKLFRALMTTMARLNLEGYAELKRVLLERCVSQYSVVIDTLASESLPREVLVQELDRLCAVFRGEVSR